MTKEYVSTQRYKAFYWDGSNVEALQDWLEDNSFDEQIDLHQLVWYEGKYDIRTKSGDYYHGLPKNSPAWLVVLADPYVRADVYSVDTFNKFFVEVAE